MVPGPGHAQFPGDGRIKWERLADGRVCYEATWPGHQTAGPPRLTGECTRHLQANEITFVMGWRRDQGGQRVIVGLKGPRVKAVRIRLLYPTRTWLPPSSSSAFFGYVPSGTVTAIVKVLANGTKKVFPFHARSVA